MSRPRVAGRCPACGSEGTLFIADGDYITCSLDKCPNPTFVADYLQSHDVWIKKVAYDALFRAYEMAVDGLDVVATDTDSDAPIRGERAMARIVARSARAIFQEGQP